MYEYKVIPAPRRPRKIKGTKGVHQQYAAVVAEEINALADEGWDYLRAETLPVDEKPGLLKSRVETYHSVLIFGRPKRAEISEENPVSDAPDLEQEAEEPYVEETYEEAPEDNAYPEDPPLTRD